ncbi:unnamed protein product [Brachionus calyciflorus]|uniref:Uncharacterized protein n=1 Tax=Brachionus calyciflorus TaxID=104777 RepID=A0A814BJ71_9BILA|nr:unnamed protein product [Brachionus calyciflorus]
MQSLFYHLTFIIGDKIPENNKYWKLYLLLSQIVEFILSNKITFNQLGQLERLIEDHHDLYLSLFPEETFKKKHHNLIHYPTAFKELGNLIDFSTIRFEAKHSFIKSASRSIHNQINILKSVSKKHQLFSLYNLVTNTQLNPEYEILKFNETYFD